MSISYSRSVLSRSWSDSWELVAGNKATTSIIGLGILVLSILFKRSVLHQDAMGELMDVLFGVLALVLVWGVFFLIHVFWLTPKRLLLDAANRENKLAGDIDRLKHRLKPKISISGNRDTENCFVQGNNFFLRAKIQSLGDESVLNVEAHIKELRRDGEVVPLGDLAQLMMHPGTPTLNALKHGVDGFMDIIKSGDFNTEPILALAWSYASIDPEVVSSNGAYELDIAVSSANAPTEFATFHFKKNNGPHNWEFAMLPKLPS